jgi:hypothetical protein
MTPFLFSLACLAVCVVIGWLKPWIGPEVVQ